MDWICFGESAKGLLTLMEASNFDKDHRPQIISLSDDLSIGDISDLNDREKRAFGICPWRNDPEFADEAESYIESYYKQALPAFEKVEEAVIWYGDNPAEQCGMLCAVHDLYARGVPFSLVHVGRLKGEELPPPRKPWKDGSMSAIGIITSNQRLNLVLKHVPMPLLLRMHYYSSKRRWKKQRARLVEFRGAGELEPETALVFYRKRRRVPACEAEKLSGRWERFVQENAPLRVLENGKVRSAPEKYYDADILANTPEEETTAAMVVGRTLGGFAVSDCLIFARIRALAEAGKLEIVKDGSNYRETTIRRSPAGK